MSSITPLASGGTDESILGTQPFARHDNVG
jgi:hypothetical protein